MNIPCSSFLYIGLDLAWSERNPSGLAVCAGTPNGARIVQPPCRLVTTDEIVQTIRRLVGDQPAILTVDAPLIVPNETGRRQAEIELAAAFRRYDAGPHPANRRLLRQYGALRGEELLIALASDGFRYAPTIDAGMTGRHIVEVFPHPATIVLFDLPRILKYKPRPGRSLNERRMELARYLELLAGLAQAEPPLHGADTVFAGLNLDQCGSATLKAVEDCADALLCAYIALYGHHWGTARGRSFGNALAGAIFTPYWPAPPE